MSEAGAAGPEPAKTGTGDRRPRTGPFSGLAMRVAGQLAIALLPIGAIAVYQAWQIGHDEARRVETALLSATAEAAAGEALAVANASGAVQVLAAHIAETPNATSGPACSDVFAAAVRAVPQFSFAGYTDAHGTLACGSSAVGRDMRDGSVYAAMSAEPEPMVVANRNGPISGASVIVSAAPVFFGDTFGGYVAISVPHTRIHDIIHPLPGEGASEAESPLRILTFNADGALLSGADDEAALSEALPAGRSLLSLVEKGQRAFTDRDQTGQVRTFAVVPIIPDVVYALGSLPAGNIGWNRVAPILFPLLMLIAGLGAAFWAVDSLVIGRIRDLGRQMREFSRSRRILPPSRKERRVSREFAEIEDTWRDLATRLVRDEADLENILHEKDVLLKEIHHRVKNNLQLIASIVNLKIRRAKSEEARRSLGEVRMRVQSIASVHQALYSGPSGGTVRAGDLLREVVGATIEAGLRSDRPVEITQDYAEVSLYPDQAVPFLLLANEAVTNALKYIGEPPGGPARIGISLAAPDPEGGEDRAVFRVVNSRGVPFFPPEQVRGSGLGRSLLSGFATQLGGVVRAEETEYSYDFCLRFTPARFDPDARNEFALADIEGEAAG